MISVLLGFKRNRVKLNYRGFLKEKHFYATFSRGKRAFLYVSLSPEITDIELPAKATRLLVTDGDVIVDRQWILLLPQTQLGHAAKLCHLLQTHCFQMSSINYTSYTFHAYTLSKCSLFPWSFVSHDIEADCMNSMQWPFETNAGGVAIASIYFMFNCQLHLQHFLSFLHNTVLTLASAKYGCCEWECSKLLSVHLQLSMSAACCHQLCLASLSVQRKNCVARHQLEQRTEKDLKPLISTD